MDNAVKYAELSLILVLLVMELLLLSGFTGNSGYASPAPSEGNSQQGQENGQQGNANLQQGQEEMPPPPPPE